MLFDRVSRNGYEWVKPFLRVIPHTSDVRGTMLPGLPRFDWPGISRADKGSARIGDALWSVCSGTKLLWGLLKPRFPFARR